MLGVIPSWGHVGRVVQVGVESNASHSYGGPPALLPPFFTLVIPVQAEECESPIIATVSLQAIALTGVRADGFGYSGRDGMAEAVTGKGPRKRRAVVPAVDGSPCPLCRAEAVRFSQVCSCLVGAGCRPTSRSSQRLDSGPTHA